MQYKVIIAQNNNSTIWEFVCFRINNTPILHLKRALFMIV